MDTQRATAAFCEDGKVAAGLGRLDHAKGVLLPGNRQVLGVVAGDLQEHAAIGSAFVGLSRRVKKPRAKAENRGDLFRSEEHTSELQSLTNLVCRLLLEKKKKKRITRKR